MKSKAGKHDWIIQRMLDEWVLIADCAKGLVYTTRRYGPRGITDPIGVQDRHGYLLSGISFKGKRYWIMLHRVIFIAANGVPRKGLEINHKDLNKTNNRIENLELVTRKENAAHAARHGVYKRAAAKRKKRKAG